MQATREELTAIVTAAHARNLRVTGHICATSFAEAAAIGIDNLEHGFVVASDFIPNRQPDVCPQNPFAGLAAVTTPEAPEAQALFATLARASMSRSPRPCRCWSSSPRRARRRGPRR